MGIKEFDVSRKIKHVVRHMFVETSGIQCSLAHLDKRLAFDSRMLGVGQADMRSAVEPRSDGDEGFVPVDDQVNLVAAKVGKESADIAKHIPDAAEEVLRRLEDEEILNTELTKEIDGNILVGGSPEDLVTGFEQFFSHQSKPMHLCRMRTNYQYIHFFKSFKIFIPKTPILYMHGRWIFSYRPKLTRVPPICCLNARTP